MKEFSRGMVRPTYIMMSEGGLTVEQVAKVFDVTVQTFHRWMREHPQLKGAVEKGRAAWDSLTAEKCLKRRVTGFDTAEITEEPIEVTDPETGQVTTEMQITKVVKKYIPPDINALRIWLNNRSPERWRDKITIDNTSEDLEERLRRAEARLNGEDNGEKSN